MPERFILVLMRFFYKWSIKRLLWATMIVALMALIWRVELTEFDPSVSVRLAKAPDPEYYYVNLEDCSLKPLWIQGVGQSITNYEYRVFGSIDADDGRVYGSAVFPHEWIRVGNIKPTRLKLRNGSRAVQVGVTIFDWRGRYKRVWSPVLDVTGLFDVAFLAEL